MKFTCKSRHIRGLVMIVGIAFNAAVGEAATYFVSQAGSDNSTCSQAVTQSGAKRTIRAGISCLVAGDTLTVMAGTYNEFLSNPFSNTGNSWAEKITVKADTQRAVVIRPSGGENGMWFDSSTQKYVEFDGIELDASNVGVYGLGIRGTAHHIRFRNSAILNAANQGVFMYGDSPNRSAPSYNEFINVEVAYTAMNANGSLKTCNGSSEGTKNGYCHGFYVGSNNNLLDNMNIHHNNGYGVQFYPQGNSGNVIRSSFVHDNNSTGVGSLGDNNQLVNNVIWNNGQNGILVTETGTQVLHNTITGRAEFRDGGGWTAKNNIVTGSLSGVSDSSNMIGGNPLFVSATDFHLQAGSPAVNAVACLAAVTTDKEGSSRPQGARCDQGAYEFGGTGTNPPPPAVQNLRITN